MCTGAMPTFIQNNDNRDQKNNNQIQSMHHSAPAPLISIGLPVILAVGGVLLGINFLKRRQ
jgi:hypothetical protein